MRSSDWSSDVCSSDLPHVPLDRGHGYAKTRRHILHLHTFHAPEQEYRPRFFGQFEQHGGRELKLLPVYKNVLRRKILLAVAILIEWFVKMIAVGNLLSQMIGQNAARCLEHVGAEVAALQFGSIAALDQADEH